MYVRRWAVAALALLAIIAIVAAAVWRVAGGSSGSVRSAAGAASSPARDLHAKAARRARGPFLSPGQLAAQRVIYAYAGLHPPASLLAALRAGEGAGIILFKANLGSFGQIRAVVDQLGRAEAASGVHAPLLILTDQEGGEVRRLPGSPDLSEREIGESANPVALAARAGTGAGRTLAEAGLNVNLSPVLDVARRRGNFIDQFQRSYGGRARAVARLGAAFIAAQQRIGIAATAKHFPGLGAAAPGQDTDSRPVILPVPPRQLRAVDEAPYRSAIAAGVKLVMTSWAVYPALDPRLPAGLSPRVIQGELRDRLGYRGVTVTDALGAAALRRFGTLAERGVMAAKAGADLIICSAVDGTDSPAGGLAVLKAIASAIARGQLNRTAAEQAAARVMALRRSLRETA